MSLEASVGFPLAGWMRCAGVFAAHVSPLSFMFLLLKLWRHLTKLERWQVSSLRVGLPEKLQVDTIDEVAAVVKPCMQLHGSSCRLVGRTCDLKRAYRQLGVCEEHFRFSLIAVWSTDHKDIKLFRMKGLPFEWTASVANV